MHSTFSLAHLTLRELMPLELIDIAADTGYDFVSLRMTPVTANEKISLLISDRNMMREVKNRLTDTGLKILDVEIIRMAPNVEPASCLGLLEAAGELGARAVIAQFPDPDKQRAQERYAEVCDMAKPFNLKVSLEFVSWTETPDIQSAVTLINGANRDNSGILVDMLHFDRSGSRVEDLAGLPHDWFHFVHLCDAPGKAPDTPAKLIEEARTNRLFPGRGDLNIRAVLSLIPDVPYSLEIPNSKEIQQYGPREYAREALRATKAFLANSTEDNASKSAKAA